LVVRDKAYIQRTTILPLNVDPCFQSNTLREIQGREEEAYTSKMLYCTWQAGGKLNSFFFEV